MKTVLTNVKDLEVENAGFSSPVKVDWINMSDFMATGSDFDMDNEPVNASNLIRFTQKCFVIVFLQLAFAALWVGSICNSKSLQLQMYEDNEMVVLLALVIIVAIYTSLGVSKWLSKSFRSHILLMSLHTISFAYLLGGLSVFFSTTAIVMTICTCLSMAVGVVCYCKLTSDTYFVPRSAICWSCLVTGLSVASMLSLRPASKTYQIIFSTILGLGFGTYSILRQQALVQNSQQKYSMKHYIVHSVRLYLDFVRALLSLVRFVQEVPRLGKKKAPPKLQMQTQNQVAIENLETENNLFKFTTQNDETKVL